MNAQDVQAKALAFLGRKDAVRRLYRERYDPLGRSGKVGAGTAVLSQETVDQVLAVWKREKPDGKATAPQNARKFRQEHVDLVGHGTNEVLARLSMAIVKQEKFLCEFVGHWGVFGKVPRAALEADALTLNSTVEVLVMIAASLSVAVIDEPERASPPATQETLLLWDRTTPLEFLCRSAPAGVKLLDDIAWKRVEREIGRQYDANKATRTKYGEQGAKLAEERFKAIEKSGSTMSTRVKYVRSTMLQLIRSKLDNLSALAPEARIRTIVQDFGLDESEARELAFRQSIAISSGSYRRDPQIDELLATNDLIALRDLLESKAELAEDDEKLLEKVRKKVAEAEAKLTEAKSLSGEVRLQQLIKLRQQVSDLPGVSEEIARIPPPQPSDVKVMREGDTFSIKWSAPQSEATTYRLTLVVDGSQSVRKSGIQAKSASDAPQLPAGCRFSYGVTAVRSDELGGVESATVMSAEVPYLPPPDQVNVNFDPSIRQATLSWVPFERGSVLVMVEIDGKQSQQRIGAARTWIHKIPDTAQNVRYSLRIEYQGGTSDAVVKMLDVTPKPPSLVAPEQLGRSADGKLRMRRPDVSSAIEWRWIDHGAQAPRPGVFDASAQLPGKSLEVSSATSDSKVVEIRMPHRSGSIYSVCRRGDWVSISPSTPISNIPTPESLEVTRKQDGDVVVEWEWNSDAENVEVVYHSERGGQGRVRRSRQDLRMEPLRLEATNGEITRVSVAYVEGGAVGQAVAVDVKADLVINWELKKFPKRLLLTADADCSLAGISLKAMDTGRSVWTHGEVSLSAGSQRTFPIGVKIQKGTSVKLAVEPIDNKRCRCHPITRTA